MIRAGFTALALAALIQGSPIPEEKPALEERQFQIGNPWTGIWPPGPPAPTPIITFPGGDDSSDDAIEIGSSATEKRQTLGGSEPSAIKKKLTALELEYESLVQEYGSHPPSDVARRLKEIAAELKKYGITIVATPDGTSTVITFGKAKRQFTIGDGGYGDPAFNLIGLETTLEQLMQEYGPNPPHDIYIVEERIKNILAAYGITIISAPDGTITIITPSTKRAAADYDIEALRTIFETFVQKYNGERPPMADWIVIQDIAVILKSYGITTSVMTLEATPTKRADTIDLGDSVNTEFLQALYYMLQGAYGGSDDTPRDIFLIQQSIATILGAQGIIIPGWKSTVPGGPLIPDRTIPGGPLVPDATVPGGPMIPDVTIPGGEMKPSTKTRRDYPALKGLHTALSTLESQYGTFTSTTVPVPVLLIMQNVVTVLQANEFVIPGWPPLLGPGTVVIGPST